jgi:hypothetical protein
MDNFIFQSPTKFVFGKNTETQVGTLLKESNAKKVLVHYGTGSIKRSGLFDRVIKAINEVGIDYLELGGVVPNPRDTLVYKGIELCKKEQVDFILAVGGGSVIDSAKAISAGALYDGDFWDFFDRLEQVKETLKVGVVLTIHAAGSEGSTSSIITKTSPLRKKGLNTELFRPVFAIINPELTFTLPTYQTAAGIVDMMSHIFERYFTKSKNVILVDRLSEATMVTIIEAAKVIIKNPTDYEARATICWASTIAHNGSLGVGRGSDWATHRLEHELSAMYDITHGAGLAVMIPAYMRYTVKSDIQRYRRFAIKVMKVKDNKRKPLKVAMLGIDRLEAFFKSLNMPTSFKEINMSIDDIPKLVENLYVNVGERVGNYQTLTMEDAKKIYELACK